ncbi:MAG: T9SS type A sorting domain-containing protein [Chitinophagaceae bacterium]|nr:T9SS type A sorting domain-containing protein [Chitinophagaceae bacterium]MBL0337086.1 T9SS type A sorting domain-containing protein [Chitinophagaceae bacterium]
MKKNFILLIATFIISFTASAQVTVTPLSFTATMQEKTVLLQWSISTSTNARFYWVEHSLNGLAWNVVATVNLYDELNDDYHYSFVHQTPAKGVNYYRLMQMEVNGRSGFTASVSVNYNNRVTSDFYVYPNPVTGGTLQLKLKNDAPVYLMNQSGQILFQTQFTAGQHSISVGQYPRGFYIVRAGTESLNVALQ